MAAVLTAAGERSAWRRRTASTTLSEREVEVLRLLARGHTMKVVAAHLDLAYKTVDRHVQNIYMKIGVGTRAGATLWAVEHGLTPGGHLKLPHPWPPQTPPPRGAGRGDVMRLRSASQYGRPLPSGASSCLQT